MTKRLAELDTVGLVDRLKGEDNLVAKFAEVLEKHDINGAVFLIMTDDDFTEIGASFGIRKSLIIYRERVLQLEAKDGQKCRASESHEPPKNKKRRPSSELIPGSAIVEASVDDIKDFDALTPVMDSKPVSDYLTIENHGEYAAPYPKLEGMISDSDGIFEEPRDTLRKQGEKSLTSNCGSCLPELPDFKSTDTPRVEYLSQNKIRNIVDDWLVANVTKSSGTLKSNKPIKNERRRQSSWFIPGRVTGEASVDDIKDFFALIPGMDWGPLSDCLTTENPGEYAASNAKHQRMISDSEGIFEEPRDTLRKQGEKSFTSNCESCLPEVPDVKSTEIPRVECLSPKKIKIVNNTANSAPGASDNKISNGPNKLSLDSRASSSKSTSSIKSIRLSGKSIVEREKLKNWVFKRRVTWEENGKKRSANDFMKLRNENEIVLEGYIQKLTGVNSRWVLNHWSNRYGLLLKSRVFLHFEYEDNTLYYKAHADLRMVERIEIPNSELKALKFEIYMSKNTKIVLAFPNESELLMWRNEMIALVNNWDLGAGEDEKENVLEISHCLNL